MVLQQNFQSLLTICLALKKFLQNPNTAFQYWDIFHQMTWYILAHMPYFRRPGHICILAKAEIYHFVHIHIHLHIHNIILPQA